MLLEFMDVGGYSYKRKKKDVGIWTSGFYIPNMRLTDGSKHVGQGKCSTMLRDLTSRAI